MKTVKQRRGTGFIKVSIARPGKPCMICEEDRLSLVRFVELFNPGTRERAYFRACVACLTTIGINVKRLEDFNAGTLSRVPNPTADGEGDQPFRNGPQPSGGLPLRRSNERPKRDGHPRRRREPSRNPGDS